MEQAITFKTDGITFSGILHHPPGAAIAVVIGCHGLIADKNSPKQIALANRCTEAGLAYLRFDHRGCGQSGGDFANDTSLRNRCSDLLAAVGAIHRLLGRSAPIGLFGSSFGGAVCLASARIIKPFAMVTLATPVESRSVHLPEDSPASLRAEIHQNRLKFSVSENLGDIDHILVIHGEKDETVSVSNARKIHRHAGNPKKLVILENGDHRITDKSHQALVMDQATGWFVKHLDRSGISCW
ncbi:MAG: damage-inducible protein CinA [Proteobacteria bacterium]|nr:MAG: damage-inducible protein CinA [Pseudomonadota bacterium]PIE68118.1 MAG: damage-inducible protein CinA [Deltaproteobacteria bacterium]